MHLTRKSILKILKKEGPLTLTEIEKKSKITNKTVALFHLKKLFKEGHILKNLDKKYVYLSDEKTDFVHIQYIGKPKEGMMAIRGEDGKYEPFLGIPIQKLPDHPKNIISSHMFDSSMEPQIKKDSFLVFKKYEKGDLFNDNDIILCGYDRENTFIRCAKIMNKFGVLLSENKKDKILYLDDKGLLIYGVLIKVF